jgi:hypothetical protein
MCSPTKSGDTNTSPKTLPYLPVPKLFNLKTPCSSNSLFLAFAAKPVMAILLGSLTIYIAGVSGLMIILNTSLSNALAIGVVPFLIGDAIKSILAMGLAFKLK